MNEEIKKIFEDIINVKNTEVTKENANMSSETPAGQMLKFASETSKRFALEHLISKEYSKLHEEGYIHIHDLDYYSTKTTTCVQYPLKELFEKGFHTKYGFIRPAKRIDSRATLATIIFQSNQNEQHGGQSIPAFDFAMADGVLKTFKDKFIEQLIPLNVKKSEEIEYIIEKELYSISISDKEIFSLRELLDISIKDLESAYDIALKITKKETHQSMEGFIHNLNTLHSRSGNQVVFSSINYGTDTSPEGRMVIEELMNATIEGLGDGETPIFPIQIFKVKEGLNFSIEDYTLALNNWGKAERGELVYKTPNFDLLIKACITSSRRLFPNFLFLDTSFNQHELWNINDPERYKFELATMGFQCPLFR